MSPEEPTAQPLTHDAGAIARVLALTALNNMGASVALVARNLLDSYYAARISIEALAALTMTVPIAALMIGLSQGISITAGNAVALGRCDTSGIGTASHRVPSAVAAALSCGALVAGGLFVLAEICLLMVDDGALRRAAALTRWLGAGAPLLFLFGTLTSILRALDHAGASARATMIGLGSGAMLTPLLMFGAGASDAMIAAGDPMVAIAIGLALGYGVANMIALSTLRRLGVPTNPLRGFNGPDLRRLVVASLPIMANNFVALGAVFAIVGLAAAAGTLDAAAYGVVFRVEQFGLIVTSAVVLAMVPLAAQAIGSGDQDGLRRTVSAALGVVFAVGISIGAVMIVGAEAIVAQFALAPEGEALAVSWLRIAGVALAFQGLILACTALLQIKRPGLALRITALRLYGVTLPALLLVGMYRDGQLYPTISATQILGGIVALFFLWRWHAGATAPSTATATTRSLEE